MLRVELKPSRYIAAALTAAHIVALVTILPLDLPVTAKVMCAVLIVVSLAHAIARHALLWSRRALTAVELREKGEVAVQTRDGEWHDARILGTSYVSPALSAINLRMADARLARHILVVADNCDPEQFRRLRVCLRWDHKSSEGDDRR
jgi:toxin CptA